MKKSSPEKNNTADLAYQLLIKIEYHIKSCQPDIRDLNTLVSSVDAEIQQLQNSVDNQTPSDATALQKQFSILESTVTKATKTLEGLQKSSDKFALELHKKSPTLQQANLPNQALRTKSLLDEITTLFSAHKKTLGGLTDALHRFEKTLTTLKSPILSLLLPQQLDDARRRCDLLNLRLENIRQIATTSPEAVQAASAVFLPLATSHAKGQRLIEQIEAPMSVTQKNAPPSIK